jgi:hypothetical protein
MCNCTNSRYKLKTLETRHSIYVLLEHLAFTLSILYIVLCIFKTFGTKITMSHGSNGNEQQYRVSTLSTDYTECGRTNTWNKRKTCYIISTSTECSVLTLGTIVSILYECLVVTLGKPKHSV